MSPIDTDAARQTLDLAARHGLLTAAEIAQVLELFASGSPLRAAAQAADTLHVHVKVDDVAAIPRAALVAAGGAVENAKDGYAKLAFPSRVNLIVSSIDVSEDDVRERGDAPGARKARPFLDHVGIDLRRETADVRAIFDAVPGVAAQQQWTYAAQGGEGKAVLCCHTSVAAKHWVYPPGRPSVEVAFGPLRVDASVSGCDLRPSDPRLGAMAVACCGQAPPTVTLRQPPK
jgi:hypothetical protein